MAIIMTTKRGFIKGLSTTLFVAPAIIRPEWLDLVDSEDNKLVISYKIPRNSGNYDSIANYIPHGNLMRRMKLIEKAFPHNDYHFARKGTLVDDYNRLPDLHKHVIEAIERASWHGEVI